MLLDLTGPAIVWEMNSTSGALEVTTTEGHDARDHVLCSTLTAAVTLTLIEGYDACDQVWITYQGADTSDAEFLRAYNLAIPVYASTTTVIRFDAALLDSVVQIWLSPHITQWMEDHSQHLILTNFKLNFKSALSLSSILTAARLLTQTKAQTLTPSCETAILAGSSLGLAHEQRMWSMLRIVLNAAVEEYGGDPADQLQNDQLTAGLT